MDKTERAFVWMAAVGGVCFSTAAFAAEPAPAPREVPVAPTVDYDAPLRLRTDGYEGAWGYRVGSTLDRQFFGQQMVNQPAPVAGAPPPGATPVPMYAMPRQMERRNEALFIVGIVGVSIGALLTLIAVPVDVACASAQNTLIKCPMTGPLVFTAISGTLLVGGIAGIIYGAPHVPVENAKLSPYFPAVAVGPTSGSLAWKF